MMMMMNMIMITMETIINASSTMIIETTATKNPDNGASMNLNAMNE